MIMKKSLFLMILPALAGCLSPAKIAPVAYWPVAYNGPVVSVPSAKYGVTRGLQIVVCAPYDGTSLTVLRADGTVAFDPLNAFAAAPSKLLKGAMFDAMVASGLFDEVIGTGSIATASSSAEVVIDRLALDCLQDGERKAVVALHVRILKGHEIVATAKGEGASDAASGNYGSAFSDALSSAFVMAFAQLR